MINIAVIIPTHNRDQLLLNTIEQLKLQILPDNCNIAIIVIIDELEPEETMRKIQKRYKDIHTLLGNGNLWYTKSINKGMFYAKSIGMDFILILNDDIYIKNKFVKHLMDASHNNRHDAVIGAISISDDVYPKITFSGVKNYIRLISKDINYHKKFVTNYAKNMTGNYPSSKLYGRGILIPIQFSLAIFKFKFLNIAPIALQKVVDNISDGFVVINETYNIVDYNRTFMESFKEYLKSIFNDKSINSIHTSMLFYKKHGYRVLIPIYAIYSLTAKLLIYFKPRK